MTIAVWAGLILFVAASWTGLTLLYRRAGERGDRKRAERAVKKEFTKGSHTVTFAHGPDVVARDPSGWALVASARFAVAANQPLDVFGFPDRDVSAQILAESWGVRTRSELLEQILWLFAVGHREQFDAERAQWLAMDPSAQKQLRRDLRKAADRSPTAKETHLRLERTVRDTGGAQSIDFLGWDLVRVIFLSRAGVGAGFLAETEARDLTLAAATGLRARYRSWAELADSYTRARWYWAGVDGPEEAADSAHEKLFTQSVSGLWSVLAWDTPLRASSFLVLGDVDRLMLENAARRALGESWQQGFLAAVRARLSEPAGPSAPNAH
ncbi:DUF1266 domain-containing protein [Ruania alba]|nr:DUF1266 domain-containing protein [Ruania alba]